MNPPPRFNVLGVLVSATDYENATRFLIAAARQRGKLAASALAVHAIVEARRNADFRSRLNTLDLAVSDGQPVRWALNWLHGQTLNDRVYGPALMLHACAAAAAENLPIFLFGGSDTTLHRLQHNLRSRFPTLQVAGMRASRFCEIDAAEAASDADFIRSSGARIVFCGLGCPRQEYWVHAMRRYLDMPLLAVGAAFPLWAGERRMAPRWMQDMGFEWLFRLAQEPRRLAHRYLIYNPWFLAALLRQKISPNTYPVAGHQTKPRFFG